MSTDWRDWIDMEEWNDESQLPWLACPDANPQRVCNPLGFRERNVGELELRVALGGDDGGVCQIIVDERDDEVYVRVLVCGYDREDDSAWTAREYVDWPVRVWLERPLGDRAVINMETDDELRLFTPEFLDNIPQPDHGYRPAHRRRRTTGCSLARTGEASPERLDRVGGETTVGGDQGAALDRGLSDE